MRFGMQFYPLPAAPQTAAYAKRAMSQHPFERLWVPDHLAHENPFVTLAAILSETHAHVGTSVTNPWCRTPVDLASSFNALAHLAGERSVTAGIGAGSSSSNMIRKQHRVGMLREMILFLREMFGGRRIKWKEFPDLAGFFRLDPAAEAFLRVPPERPPEIFVAAAGPQTLKIAGDLGDGVILSNLSFPTALIRQGALADAMAKLPARAARFTKVLHLHVSVARDGEAARRFARRMAVNGLIGGHLLGKRMVELPVPAATWAAIQEGHRQGKAVEELDPLISESVIEESGIVVAGTPAQCFVQLDEVLRLAKPYRFDIVDMASPLGPDWNDAIDIICQEILPELERRSSAYVEK
ncbi:MAG TPA: LLM class flavin-dependent oxidoreductase [Candidatus Binatia bacterium]|nr:LLM class flavin-dependent oxidoreductase [Candidatus Binatia bacterium]